VALQRRKLKPRPGWLTRRKLARKVINGGKDLPFKAIRDNQTLYMTDIMQIIMNHPKPNRCTGLLAAAQ
jgi:hypothetical protein